MSESRADLTSDQLDHFFLILQGHAAFQLMWAGLEFGVFDFLDRHEGATRAGLAEVTRLTPQPLRILLTGLCALGLLQRRNASYFNSEIAAQLLVSTRPANLTGLAGWQRHIVYPGLADLSESLRQGKNVGLRHFPGSGDTLYQRLAQDSALEQVFQNAMSSLSSHANAELAEHLDLSASRHLLDVGGGDGTNAMALATKFSGLRVTIFDLPSVCDRAEARIAAAGLSARVDCHVGDLFETPFPSGLDTILFCHMFTIFSPADNQRLIQKAFDSLVPGGRLVIFNMMGDDDEQGPVSTALGSAYFLAIATGAGMLYSWADYEGWLEESGFVSFERIAGLKLDHGIFIAHKR